MRLLAHNLSHLTWKYMPKCFGAEKRKHPNIQESLKFYKTITPFLLVRYVIGYSQLVATRLNSYLPSYIQNTSWNNC